MLGMKPDTSPATDASNAAAAQPVSRLTWRERCCRVLLVLASLSAGLHLWPKDRWAGLVTWFYATPWGVILAMSVTTTLGLWLSNRRNRSPWLNRGAITLLIVAAGMWLLTDWDWGAAANSSPSSSDPIRLLTWNISSGIAGWERIASDIHRYNPDVICLVEAGRSNNGMRSTWKSLFPGYRVSMLGGGIVCIVRGDSGECHAVELTPFSRLRVLPVIVRGAEFQCAIVDIESSIFNSRATPLHGLAEELARFTGPITIAGDFNTPTDSIYFAELSNRFSSVAHDIGSGYSATWPLPVPVMDLDQVWCSEEVAPLNHTLGWSWASDHRPVIVDFVLGE